MFTNSFNGIMNRATWKLTAITRGTDEDKPVKVSAAGTVSLCVAEDIFIGVIESIDRDNAFGVVNQKGFVTLPYTGTAPAVGSNVELVANAAGGVKVPATAGTGKRYVVAEVNTTALTVTFYLG